MCSLRGERELFDGIDKIEWKCKGVHGKIKLTFLEKKGGVLMSTFMVVSKVEQLAEYKAISEQYGVSFELNDFFDADVLDDTHKQDAIIHQYEAVGIPEGSTMHGAFFDVVVFSTDAKIREISQLRMKQSMDIARRLGLRGVVFHTNCNPMLDSEAYDNNVVSMTASYLEELLQEYTEIDIYLENMFDASPKILREISQCLAKYSNYGVCLDYAHASISNTPMQDWVEELAPYLKHIHINDNDLKSDLHLPLGAGQINWNQFVKYYRTHFDQCSILIETTSPGGQRQSLQYLKESFVGVFR